MGLTVEEAQDKRRRKAGLGGSRAGEKQDSLDPWGYNTAAHRQGGHGKCNAGKTENKGQL